MLSKSQSVARPSKKFNQFIAIHAKGRGTGTDVGADTGRRRGRGQKSRLGQGLCVLRR
jgi:hypothetical protein